MDDRRGWAPWIGRGVVVAAVLAAVAAQLAEGAGVSGTELATGWQLIDLRALSDNPLSSVWYLHTQPPAYNLVVGLVAWSPLPLAGTLFVLYVAALLVAGLLLHDLLIRWGTQPLLAGGITALAMISPTLLGTITIASYEVPVSLLLIAALWAIQRHLDDPRFGWLLLISAVLTLGALTRSLLHPVFVLTILGLLCVVRPVTRRQAIVTLGLPVLLVGGWMLKNQVLYDQATTSSWLGFNLQRGVVGPMNEADVQAAVADGTVSSLALEYPWDKIGRYEAWIDGCEPSHANPVTRLPSKEPNNGLVIHNYNYECYLPLYAQAQDDALALIRRHPGRYLETREPALLMSFQPAYAGYEGPTTWVDKLYKPLLLVTQVEVPIDDWNLPLYETESLTIRFSVTLALLTLIVLVRAGLAAVRLARLGWRTRREWPGRELIWLVVGWTVVVIVLGGDLVEFGENGRFRASLDPLIVALPLQMGFAAVQSSLQVHRRGQTVDERSEHHGLVEAGVGERAAE